MVVKKKKIAPKTKKKIPTKRATKQPDQQRPSRTIKLYPEPGEYSDVFIENGNEAEDFDWHNFPMLSTLTWKDLIHIIFGENWYVLRIILNSSNPEKFPNQLVTAQAANDLLSLIVDASRDEKLNCGFDSYGDPTFNARDIGEWIIEQEILAQLIKKKGILISRSICKFIQKVYYGRVVSPLKTNETGDIDWEHYASLPKWRWEIALQILREGHPWDRKKVADGLIPETMNDTLFKNAVENYDVRKPMKWVYPAAFCVLALCRNLAVPTPLFDIFDANGKLEKEFCRVEKLISSQKEETKALEEEGNRLRKKLETAHAQQKESPKPIVEVIADQEVETAAEVEKKEKTSPNPATEKKQTKKKAKAITGKKKNSHSRSDPGGVIQAAIQGLKDNGVNQASIPYNREILKLLPKKNTSIDRTIEAKEYEETTGMKFSTIKTLAREVYAS